MYFLDDGGEAEIHAVVSGSIMAIVVLMREIQCHFYFEELLLFRGLVPEGLLVEGEADDDCLDGRPLLIHFLVFLELFGGLALQLDIAEQSVLGDDDVQVVFLHAQYLHLHDHVSL
jgi:hypothetical protein